jgi:Tol biopolymer transport system component
MEPKSKRFVTSASSVFLCASAFAQVTQRENLSSSETQANGSSFNSALSGDGRYLVFESDANNLVPGDTNGAKDIFVRDRLLGTTERVSVDSNELQSNAVDFWAPVLAISADGRFVTFTTDATNLVAGDTNGVFDVFIRDRQLGTTERVSVDSNGVQANGVNHESSLSRDGRYIAFRSYASNLVPGDTNGHSDIFVRDQLAGTTERVSVGTNGNEADSNNQNAAISADGRYVAFTSYATTLVTTDTNNFPDVYLRDRVNNTTERISMGTGGQEPNGACHSSSISADGRFITLQSDATNLVSGDTNVSWDSFVYDRQTGTTDRVSISTSGAQGGSFFVQYPSPVITADGRYVVFSSEAGNLINGDTNGVFDVFMRDRLLGTTERVSVGTESVQGNATSMIPFISENGRFVSFTSASNNFESNDTNQAMDIFVRDANPTSFTSLCTPGVNGVAACPCANPPSNTGRGCDNSAATGGAALTASGVAYVSEDSLTFTASGEPPTALSILLQGSSPASSGIVFGQGVRCVDGSLKRLFVKTASGGSILAPDVLAGDPTVSAQSAVLGDVITAGQSRWYFVYYRDQVVLGGCSATSTFNATQTGKVTWWP